MTKDHVLTARKQAAPHPSTSAPVLLRCGGVRCPPSTCNHEDEAVVRRSTNTAAASRTVPDSVTNVLRSSGRPLDGDVRAGMEQRFGHDFSRVRIHADPAAQESARDVSAHAYTAGRHIVMGRGTYQPHTDTGLRLLTHELTHVVQQGNPATDIGPPRAVSNPRDPAEVEAAGLADEAQPLPAAEVGSGIVHRQAEPSAAATGTVQLCFVPIRAYGLGAVGGLHAVLNIPAAGQTTHVEVDPNQHQAAADPLAPTEGVGHVAGLHSHVVIAGGEKANGTCQPVPVTPAQTTALLAAARRYESLDVGYEPPGLGPNSNSFAEWALNEAGVDTSLLPAPTGAAGWSYYQDHPDQRAAPPRVARTFGGVQQTCPTAGTPARSFAPLVALVGKAEAQLSAGGVTDVGRRLTILRGIYYGTPWSQDFKSSQSSPLRNLMFNVYSGTEQPDNPLRFMDCDTFLSLARSQDVVDGNRSVDVGHLLIGMDARRSAVARTVAQPVGQVTGLEAVTWAGDLGGGAARLALARLTRPTVVATEFFRGTDYGGSINLEGDVAGYAVASGGGTAGAPAPLTIPAGSGVANALASYLLGGGTTARGWDSRCEAFLSAVGGRLDAAKKLTNRPEVLDYLTEQIHDFGCWYLVNWVRQNEGGNTSRMEQASRHVAGASGETATLFLGALERCAVDPKLPLQVTGPAPSVTPIGSTSCYIARTAPEAGEAGERVRRGVGKAVEDAERWVDEQRRQAERAFRRWWGQ
jgi:hypothetical protein